MLLINEASLFWTVEFLIKIMVKNILEVLKAFIIEGKRQTEQKLMWVRIDCE